MVVRMKGIDFIMRENPTVELPFDGTVQFTRMRVGNTTYKIFVPDADVSKEELLLPYFAPMDFVGLSAVETRREKDGLTLMVHVERNAHMHVTRSKTGLRLSIS